MASTPTNNQTSRTPRAARTPIGRAATAEPPSSRPSIHTPLDRTTSRDLLNSVRRAASVSASGGPYAPGHNNANNAPTPHAKLARRALHDRRTAIFTPGKNRRRSLMDQRETPMDILRNLSRKLAPTSKPIRTSSSVSSSSPSVASAGATPSVTGPSRRRTAESSRWSVGTTQPIPEESAGHADYRDDDDEEEELRPPRLSLPIDQDDDDEEELRPPRPSILEDFDYTMNSVEFPRRMDFDQQAAGRLSRGSLGSMRPSDVFDVSQLPVDSPRRQSDFFPEQIAEDVGEFQRIDAEPGRRSSLGRMSDFALEMPEGLDGQTTFMMSEPGDDVAPTSPIAQEQAGPSEPVVNQEVDREETGVVAANAADAVPPTPAPAPMSEPSPPPLPMDDFSDREPIEDIPDRSDDEDREPMEDIPERSDDGGAPVDDAPPEDYDAPMDDGGGFSDAGGGEDDDAGGYDYDQDAAAPVDAVPDVSTTSATAPAARAPKRRSEGHVRIREAMPPRRKRKLISRHGIEYPSLPPTFVKRVAQTALQSSGLSNPRVSADTLVALTQASEWFFEQLGDDLGAFANHAKRKTIEESDVVTLMRRQRQISSSSTVFSLAQQHLPRELLQELRMPIPESAKRRKGKQADEEEEEEDDSDDDT